MTLRLYVGRMVLRICMLGYSSAFYFYYTLKPSILEYCAFYTCLINPWYLQSHNTMVSSHMRALHGKYVDCGRCYLHNLIYIYIWECSAYTSVLNALLIYKYGGGNTLRYNYIMNGSLFWPCVSLCMLIWIYICLRFGWIWLSRWPLFICC